MYTHSVLGRSQIKWLEGRSYQMRQRLLLPVCPFPPFPLSPSQHNTICSSFHQYSPWSDFFIPFLSKARADFAIIKHLLGIYSYTCPLLSYHVVDWATGRPHCLLCLFLFPSWLVVRFFLWSSCTFFICYFPRSYISYILVFSLYPRWMQLLSPAASATRSPSSAMSLISLPTSPQRPI